MTERKDALPCRMQDLPPAGARLCMAVGRFLKEKCGVSPHHVIVAFSGGADSTALAVILRCLGVSLVLAHLDHRLRPESGEEAESARRFAERLGVPCMVRRVDVEALARSEGIGLEDAGRRARYAFFDSALLSERAEWVVTGHHLDDLSEDVLMRLVRGSGWPGLGGMKAVDRPGVSCALCWGRHGRSWRLFSALSAWTGSKTPRTGAMPSGATVCAIMSFRC